jgi:hypothetical protein
MEGWRKMKIAEINKRTCNDCCSGDYKKAIEDEYYILIDEKFIKNAFNFGNGTTKHLKEHIKNNRCFCVYYDLDKKAFI